ncbi:hypothetical protein ACHAXR_009816 [Thalassiosira sp. AJA248-18]
MTSTEVEVDISATFESDWGNGDCPAPLPTKEIARRKSVEDISRKTYGRRRTSVSLKSFTSDSSVGSDPCKIVEVGNLRFLNDSDMKDGQSPILGKGSFAMVRLAKRRPQHQRSASQVSVLSCSDHGDIVEPDSPRVSSDSSSMSNQVKSGKGEDVGALVAVKIFEKSLLQKCRTIERDSQNQMKVRTALENVEREIAVMKIIAHPNLTLLYEVIDTGSNRLYMVMEYVPLGQIMTNVQGTGMYKRRPMRKGETKLLGVTPDGYFDEEHAALYFVDIMHGLAHLHQNHIAHRDLKPENILLAPEGIAKISDFGVAHLFEDEMNSAGRASLEGAHLSSNDAGIPSARISRSESDAALKMKSMSDMGKLTKTEGTWCFWSPEMCAENSLVFSGYACDIWAAGICLYIFATGSLPFYTEIPLALFDKIAEANVKFDDAKMSDDLIGLLKEVLAKDPAARAGVGDCLKHQFCKGARQQRTKELGEEVEMHEEVIVQKNDLRQAFSVNKESSVQNLAKGMSKRFTTFKNRLSGSPPSQRSMSIGGESMSIDGGGSDNLGRERRYSRRLSESFAFWRSQKTMSMDEEGTPRKRSWQFWRSSSQMRY